MPSDNTMAVFVSHRLRHRARDGTWDLRLATTTGACPQLKASCQASQNDKRVKIPSEFSSSDADSSFGVPRKTHLAPSPTSATLPSSSRSSVFKNHRFLVKILCLVMMTKVLSLSVFLIPCPGNFSRTFPAPIGVAAAPSQQATGGGAAAAAGEGTEKELKELQAQFDKELAAAEERVMIAEQRAKEEEAEAKKLRELLDQSSKSCESMTKQMRERVGELEAIAETAKTQEKKFEELSGRHSEAQKAMEAVTQETAILQAKVQSLEAVSDANVACQNDLGTKTSLVVGLRKSVNEATEKIRVCAVEKAECFEKAEALNKSVIDLERKWSARKRGGASEGGEDSYSASSDQQHVFSSSMLKSALWKSFLIYHAAGEVGVAMVPAHWWETASQMQVDAKMFAAPYWQKVDEHVLTPIAPFVSRGYQVFEDTVVPTAIQAWEKVQPLAVTYLESPVQRLNTLFDDYVVAPLLMKNPEIAGFIPPGPLDRFLFVAFLLFVLVVACKIFFFTLRCVFHVCCPRCCGRRRHKSRSGKSSSSSYSSSSSGKDKKRFIPAQQTRKQDASSGGGSNASPLRSNSSSSKGAGGGENANRSAAAVNSSGRRTKD